MVNKRNKKVDEKDFVKLAIIVGVLVLAYFVYANFIPKNFESSLKVNVIEIGVDCVDCINISLASATLIDAGIEIKNHEVYDYNSDKGKKMIEKYGIKKVPALIVVSKKIDKLGIDSAFDVKKNYAIFKMNTPYIEIDSGELRGVVNIIEISPECDECFSLMPLKNQFEKLGVKIGSYEIISAESVRGLEIISTYNLNFAPTLLISKNLDEYDWIMPGINGALEDKEEYYLFKNAVAPYKDLKDGLIKGLVDITSITDLSCEECFDINKLKQSFQSIGVYFNNEKILDISSSEGKKFAKKYNITAVPTVVLSKEILDYPQMRDALKNIGTFDDNDLSFVFRKLDAVGKSKKVDL